MIAQLGGQDQRNYASSEHECTVVHPRFLPMSGSHDSRAAYIQLSLGTGRVTETPDEKANKLRQVFEDIRRNLEKATQDQARHFNLRWWL